MSDLIDRKELQKQMVRTKIEINDGQDYADWYIHCVETATTVDAEPVRHGHLVWKRRRSNSVKQCTGRDAMGDVHTIQVVERLDTELPYCSECGMDAYADQKWCRYCGAKMDGKGAEKDGR